MSNNMIVSFERSSYAEAFTKAKDKQKFIELFWYLSTWGALGDALADNMRVSLRFYPELGEVGATYTRDGQLGFYIHALEEAAGTWIKSS